MNRFRPKSIVCLSRRRIAVSVTSVP